jgi:hypothetical protein
MTIRSSCEKDGAKEDIIVELCLLLCCFQLALLLSVGLLSVVARD